MSGPMHRSPHPKHKVFWSDRERKAIVDHAIELQATHPNLTGLVLLREAMGVLPPERRRPLIALSQAPWFLPMVEAELGRRELEGRVVEDTVAVIKDQTRTHSTLMQQQFARYDRMLLGLERMAVQAEEHRSLAEAWREEHEVWRESVLRFNKVAEDALKGIAAVSLTEAQQSKEWMSESRESMASLARTQAEMVSLLGQIARELAVLNRRLGTSDTAPVKRPRGQDADSTRRA